MTFTRKQHYLEDSDLWLMDWSYLRLKVLDIGYTFGQSKALSKVGIKSLRIYLSGYNLLTFFSELNDMDIDPEGPPVVRPSIPYPNVRIFNLGVNLAF